MSITLGILVSYWLEFGTQYIGGTRCAPDIPYTGGSTAAPEFDPVADVGTSGCTGQSEASWRLPLAMQILPAVVLGLGMLFYPESPRYYLMRQKEDKALESLACIRRVDVESEALCREYLAIKAEVLFEETYGRDRYPGKTGVSLYLAEYSSLVSNKASLKRLTIGCVVMFFQQFMGCNAIIYCQYYSSPIAITRVLFFFLKSSRANTRQTLQQSSDNLASLAKHRRCSQLASTAS